MAVCLSEVLWLEQLNVIKKLLAWDWTSSTDCDHCLSCCIACREWCVQDEDGCLFDGWQESDPYNFHVWIDRSPSSDDEWGTCVCVCAHMHLCLVLYACTVRMTWHLNVCTVFTCVCVGCVHKLTCASEWCHQWSKGLLVIDTTTQRQLVEAYEMSPYFGRSRRRCSTNGVVRSKPPIGRTRCCILLAAEINCQPPLSSSPRQLPLMTQWTPSL